jgi:putative membrane protein
LKKCIYIMHIYKCLQEQVEDVAQNERGILNREEREQRTELESRARTHLANERTFLAWLRTGIALISLGLAAAQFLERQVIHGLPLIRGMSIIMVVTGILMAVDGTRRYIRHSKQIEAGAFRVTTRSAEVVGGLVALLGLMAIVFILALRQ